VQKAGNAVHINVQLIGAAQDEHLWAESCNRTLDDIFGVEGEVAQAVVDALRARFLIFDIFSILGTPTTRSGFLGTRQNFLIKLRGCNNVSGLVALSQDGAPASSARTLDPDSLTLGVGAFGASFRYHDGSVDPRVIGAQLRSARSSKAACARPASGCASPRS
jgi:hypothetical protein